jgi:hypothetical protein
VKFFMGTHMPHWLERTDVPLFVSHRRLQGRKTLPRAAGRWALDSGGFTELSMYGAWRTSRADYIAAVTRYADEIGNLDWASPQDWMCEPWIVAKTGLTVAEHQQRTIDNYLSLRTEAPDLPFVPVLQGWQLDDYRRHADAYAKAGIDLQAEPTVGIGSVCRRQAGVQIDNIVWTLATEGLKLHGFGVKTTGLRTYGQLLASADSMAWSFGGRRIRPPECGSTTHQSEANCLTYALSWRRRVLAGLAQPEQLTFGAAS